MGHDGLYTGTGKFTELTGTDAVKLQEVQEKIGKRGIIENSYKPTAFETIAN